MKSEKRPIEIEDLLRLKRTERPPADFWARFDRELRAKQLAALVERRPWWQTMPRLFSGVSRYRLPLGAAAMLALTVVAVRHSPTTPAGMDDADPSPRPVPVTSPVAVAAPAEAPSRMASPVLPSIGENTPPVLVARVETAVAPAPVAAATNSISSQVNVSILSTSGDEFARNEDVGGLRPMGAALMVRTDGDLSGARGFLTQAATGFEARALPVRSAVDPLQHITPPGERSRAKLLTAMLSMTTVDTPARTGERAADRISEERLYDQVSRFGARGAGVSMKF